MSKLSDGAWQRGLNLVLATVIGLTAGCRVDGTSPSSPTTPPIEDRDSWKISTQQAIAAAGLRGLVGVQLRRLGSRVVPVRIIGGMGDSQRLQEANRVLVRHTGGLAVTPAFSVADAGLFIVDPVLTTGTTTTFDYETDWGCADESTGGVWQPASVTIDGWQQHAVANTGGHLTTSGAHPIASKTKGTWSGTSAGTGPDGHFLTTFTAGDVAGEETIDYTVTGVSRCTGTSNWHERYSIGLEGLIELVDGTNGLSVPRPTSAHSSVGYVTSDGAPRIYAAQAIYAGTGDFIRVTAAALPEGGLNDIAGQWAPPHSTHRSGNEVDMVGKYSKEKVGKKVRLVPDAKALQQIEAAGDGIPGLNCDLETSRRGTQLDRSQWHVHCTTT